MSLVETLLIDLQRQGVKLWAEGDQLKYKAPKGVITNEILARIKSHKGEILEFCRKADAGSSTPPIHPADRSGFIPLSFAQRRLWFLYQYEGMSSTYNVTAALWLDGTLDVNALENSVNEIIRRHETLRTTFTMAEGKSAQVVSSELKISIPLLNLAPLADENREARLRKIWEDNIAEPFDLTKGPLIRVRLARLAEKRHALFIAFHHIVSDFWSIGVFVHELKELYSAFIEGKPAALDTLTIQYGDYAAWQRKSDSDGAGARSLEYWKNKLEGAPPLLDLPTDRPRPKERTFRGAIVNFHVDKKLADAIAEIGKRTGASLFMTLLSAYAVLLHRYSGQDDIIVGSHIANRPFRELEPLIGCFVNTLALRMNVAGDPSFTELLERVRATALEALERQDTPFEQIVDALKLERNTSYAPLAQVMFVLQNAPVKKLELPGLVFTPFERERHTAKFDLTLEMEETEDGIRGEFEYNTDLFDGATIDRLTKRFMHLLGELAARPAEKISRLRIIDDMERETLITAFNAVKRQCPVGETLKSLFEKQVSKTPDAMAVSFENSSLTYRELNAAANRIAHHLINSGARPNDRVAICFDRSMELIVAIIAVIKAGAAYVPLDPAYPVGRLDYMIKDADAGLILTTTALAKNLHGANREIISLDDDSISRWPATDPDMAPAPNDLAYVIYTSGSTGVPKGVMIEHRQVINLLEGLRESIYEKYNDAGRLNIALMAAAVFDASVQQIFAALLRGHTLHLMDEETRRDGERLREYFVRNAINISDCTPSLMNIMVSAGLPGIAGLRLRELIVGGEPLPTSLIEEFYRQDTGRRISISNVYGPTECCVDVTCYTIDPARMPAQAIVPIGRPLANSRIYVIDKYGAPCPIGIPGEIYIAGDGLGRGYINNSAMTAEKFVAADSVGEARVYKTGDIGRWRDDGNIEFFGRNDDQVKIRGHRIELGEIENHLRSHPTVKDAVALAKKVREDYKELVAYLTLDTPLTIAQLRSFAAEKLPDYMIPAFFVNMESFPLNPSGKVDRKSLPEPDSEHALSRGTEYAAPEDENAIALASVWKDVLGAEKVGVNDNYFSLGGDSIKALQIVARLRDRGMKMEIRDIFTYQTIAGLAPRLVTLETAVAKTDNPIGEIPLTAIQRWFFREYEGARGHFNQAIILESAEPIDASAFGAALLATQNHHDALRSKFRMKDGHWIHEICGTDYPLGFEVVDLRDAKDVASAITDYCEQAQRGLDLENGPLFKVALFKTRVADKLFLFAHHLIIDGVSWRIILRDLAEAYQAIRSREAPRLPVKTDSFRRWATKINEYAGKIAADEIEYWRGVAERNTPEITPDYPNGASLFEDCAQVGFALSSADTRTLLHHANDAFNTRINDLLLAALARAIRDWCGNTFTTVTLEGHGRDTMFADMDVSGTVGWFTAMYPVVFDISGADDAGRHIKLVKETLRGVPGNGIGYGVIKYLTSERLAENGGSPILFNYLGQFGQGDDAGLLKISRENTGSAKDPKSRWPWLFEINSMIVDDCFEVSITYGGRRFRRDTVSAFARQYQNEIVNIINLTSGKGDTDITPSDIDYDGFSVDELDSFLNKL